MNSMIPKLYLANADVFSSRVDTLRLSTGNIQTKAGLEELPGVASQPLTFIPSFREPVLQTFGHIPPIPCTT